MVSARVAKLSVVLWMPVVGLGCRASDPHGDGTATTGGVEMGGATSGGDVEGESEEGSGMLFDLPSETPYDACGGDGGDGGPIECEEESPPDSFEPVVEWTWGTPGVDFVWSTPLVGNLTDDDDNGVIDACDTPDIVAMVGKEDVPFENYSVAVFDGATGKMHWQSEPAFRGSVNPAIGDIDGDGEMEIIAARPIDWLHFRLVAFNADGSVLWQEPEGQGANDIVGQGTAIELADVDNDGDVEILAFTRMIDHQGKLVTQFELSLAPDQTEQDWTFPLTADLDGDEDMEVILGYQAFHHDGNELWSIETDSSSIVTASVADFDDDSDPEVLFSYYTGGQNGKSVLADTNGSVLWEGPTGARGGVAITDLDGAGTVEFAVSKGSHFRVFAADGSLLWEREVNDMSGISSGSAFDFLGDGTADVIYADETNLHAWDSEGTLLFSAPRGSGTLFEYPTVADVDNDGSADIVVPSNNGSSPPLQVLRDKEDRWVRARRIYNQYNYRISNISELGVVPKVEPKNWKTYNNLRVQGQISADGEDCIPPVG